YLLSILLLPYYFFFQSLLNLRALHSFPTRRSSDLHRSLRHGDTIPAGVPTACSQQPGRGPAFLQDLNNTDKHRELHTLATSPLSDRKSTRLNSSHLVISYAVFCLKKKKTQSHT